MLAHTANSGGCCLLHSQPAARECTGNFFIDVEVLIAEGLDDFDKYAVQPGRALVRDFFLDGFLSKEVVHAGFPLH